MVRKYGETNKKFYFNTHDYNLISVPQITRVVVESRRGKGMVKLELIEQSQQSCQLFEFFIVNEKSDILMCFCSIKFEKKLIWQ